MNIKEIRELARIARENGLSALEVSENDVRVRIEREILCAAPSAAAAQQEVSPVAAAAVAQNIAPAREDSNVNFNRVHELKSQMVGVFYAAPSPDAKPFVSVGDRVKKGDVVCIIEAMKLMNEIAADRDGEVVDICVRNGDVVEFGQTLLKLC